MKYVKWLIFLQEIQSIYLIHSQSLKGMTLKKVPFSNYNLVKNDIFSYPVTIYSL